MYGTRDQFGVFSERDHGRWLTILLLLAASGLNAHTARVVTKFGEIQGLWSRSTRGRLVAHYLGIPYAKPPIGDLRFSNPQPWNHSWNTSYDATKNGPICIQADVKGNTLGSEDCLYLNVFVPRISEKQKTISKLPVLVFVPGERYMIGGGDSHKFPPDYLMDQNVILVTMNYRINILGFFSTENKVSPGNYGIKDVLMSVRWIHENIEFFHGDTNSVTLWGHSAGAAIVHALALTKKTEGLFHRYILQSGSMFSPWSLNKKTWIRQKSLEVARMLDCFPGEMEESTKSVTEEDDKDMMRCMRSVDAEKFGRVIASFDGAKIRSISPFGPIIESETEDGILTAHPITAIKNKLFRDIPCIIGVTKDEGLIMTMRYMDTMDEVLDNLELYLPYLLEYTQLGTNISAFISAIEDFYLKSNDTKILWQNVNQATGDSMMVWPAYQTVNYQSAVMKSSIYFYMFGYEGTFSDTFSFETTIYHGVTHADDLNYFFPTLNKKFKDLMLHNTESDETVINMMTEMWSNFAIKGVPSAWRVPEWPDYKDSHQFLQIGIDRDAEIFVGNDFLFERMAFWDELTRNFSLLEVDLDPMTEAPIKVNKPNISISNEYNKLLMCLLLFVIVCLSKA